jgi:hypothetical protein
MSALATRKEPTERAIAWIERTSFDDTQGRLRKGMAFKAAELAEIGGSREKELLELSRAMEQQPGELARLGTLYLRKLAQKNAELPSLTLNRDDLSKRSLEELELLGWVTYAKDGGDAWHEWFFSLKKELAGLQCGQDHPCSSGSWQASGFRERLITTAMRTLFIEHYRCWYCRSVFRKRKQ